MTCGYFICSVPVVPLGVHLTTVSYTHLLMTKGNMTGQDIIALFAANKFSVSPDVVEELLDLEVGTLTTYKETPKIIEFPAIQKAEE